MEFEERRLRQFRSFQRHPRKEGEREGERDETCKERGEDEKEQQRAGEQPRMCMNTTNQTDGHIFFLCLSL